MAFIDQTKIFYGASAFLGILAIFYFGFEYLVALSPFTISIILFALFLAFLGVGIKKEENTAVLSYIFSAGAYIIGLMYTTGKFNFNSDQIMLSLVFSSGLFAGLGYLITQREFELEKEQFMYGLAAITVIVGGLIVYDIASDPVRYDYSIVDEVEINDSMVVGEVTVEKTSYLPQESRSPDFHVCAYNSTGVPRRGFSAVSESVDTMQFGKISETVELEANIDTEDLNIEGNVPVEEAQNGYGCEEIEDGAAKLVVIRTSEDILMSRAYD